MRDRDFLYGHSAHEHDALRGSLLMCDESAGLEIRRLARTHKLQPEADLLARLDDRMLVIRYCARTGVSLDRFAEIMQDVVTVGRASVDRTVELLAWALAGRRLTLAQRSAAALEQAAVADAAGAEVSASERAAEQWRERTRRTKLVPWICGCTHGPTLQVSYGAELRAHCDGCGESFRRKNPPPTIDLAAAIASREQQSGPVPF